MAKTNMIPTGLTERPLLIDFSWSPDNAGIIKPWLNVEGEWGQPADLPAGASIAISVENVIRQIITLEMFLLKQYRKIVKNWAEPFFNTNPRVSLRTLHLQ